MTNYNNHQTTSIMQVQPAKFALPNKTDIQARNRLLPLSSHSLHGEDVFLWNICLEELLIN